MHRTSRMGTGSCVIQGPFLAMQLRTALSEQRLIVNEKEKIFKLTKWAGSEDTRKEAKVLKQKPYVCTTGNLFPHNNTQSVSADFLQ